jgi:hypothetical protein
MQLSFLALLLLIVSYKYFLIIMELIIMNISILVYTALEEGLELSIIFIYYLVLRVCERVIDYFSISNSIL